MPDPLDAGLITEDLAMQSIAAFYNSLGTYHRVLDPQLHTLSYLRQRSPLLLSIVLTIGCQICKMGVEYMACRNAARLYAVQAIKDAEMSVEVVQSFLLLTFWKLPGDSVSDNLGFLK
jgi:hypothetical protein